VNLINDETAGMIGALCLSSSLLLLKKKKKKLKKEEGKDTQTYMSIRTCQNEHLSKPVA